MLFYFQDTGLVFHSQDEDQTKYVINHDLHELGNWSKRWLMSFNPDKTFYSIVKWNSEHNHKEPSSFQEQDRALENQIIQLNSEIKKLNERNQTFSPDFNLTQTLRLLCIALK
jgi:hypothetical protein